MLTGTRVDDDAVLAGSLHARVRACWIHARTGPTHACTGPTHACLHQVPMPARSQGPSRTLAPGPLARSLAGPISHARTGSPRPLGLYARTHRVPMPAHSWGPHARTHAPGHAHSLAPGPHSRSVSMHAPGPARMLAPGPHARSHAGSPRTHARTGPCTHARTGPPRPLGFHARTHRALRTCSLQVPTPARTRGPHACVHRAYARTLAPGPHARSLAGSPCAPDPCTHACCIPCCMY